MMSTVGDNIRMLRRQRGESQRQLGEAINCSRDAVAGWELGRAEPGSDAMVAIAQHYGVTVGWLVGSESQGDSVSLDTHPTRRIPIIGKVACGDPILAIEEYDEYLDLPEEILPANQVIAPRMIGESMVAARLRDGDLALIRVQETIDDGDVAAVCVGDDHGEATIKRVRYVDGYVMLQPMPAPGTEGYAPTAHREEHIRIVGRVVGIWWG